MNSCSEIGWLLPKRFLKSSRSSMRATVVLAASLSMPPAPSWFSQVELKQISVLAGSRILYTCSW